jgi:hypothetical protein
MNDRHTRLVYRVYLHYVTVGGADRGSQIHGWALSHETLSSAAMPNSNMQHQVLIV